MLRAFHPFLKVAEGAQVYCMTSRVGGEQARAYWGAYATSKAAFEMLAQTYAEENAALKIAVTIVDPGAMRTDMRAQAMPGEDAETLPPAQDLAPLINQLIDQGMDAPRRIEFRNWQNA